MNGDIARAPTYPETLTAGRQRQGGAHAHVTHVTCALGGKHKRGGARVDGGRMQKRKARLREDRVRGRRPPASPVSTGTT